MPRFSHRPPALIAGSACALALLTASGGGSASAAHQAPAGRSTHASGVGDHLIGPIGKHGRWTVARAKSAAYRVTWTAPTPLPQTDARPEIIVDGPWAGPATLSANGRQVSVLVAAADRPTAADLDLVLGGKTLDEQSQAGSSHSYQRPAHLKQLLDDPGIAGPHQVTSDDYSLDPVKLPDIPKLSELAGHVVAPTDATSSSPLVLFLHGRHDSCYQPAGGADPRTVPLVSAPNAWHCPAPQIPLPSYLGYDYVQRLLASQGYVTVSISADAVNDLDFKADDGGAAARAALIRDHLDQWVQFVADGTQHADLKNVILVGHSRGGEGVNRAALNLPTGAGYAVTGQVLIAPTDFAFQAAPLTPTVTVLPYCDGDVADLEGQNFIDGARDLGLRLAFHSSILVMGANHNFFNTEWTPGVSAAPSSDDWSGATDEACGTNSEDRLNAQEQREVAKTYIAGAVHLFANDNQNVLPMFDGSAVNVASAGNADVRSHAIGGGIDTRRPGTDATVGEPSGLDISMRLCTGVADSPQAAACEPAADSWRTPHWPSASYAGVPLRQAFELHWDGVDQTVGIDLKDPWDLSRASHLDLRTILDATLGTAAVDVRLVDRDGGSATITPENAGILTPLPGKGLPLLPKRWGQTLRVDLHGVSGVDLADVIAINLITRAPSGHLWILDLSAAPAAGISRPTGQTPLISFGTVMQDEGDGPGDATLSIPYEISGELRGEATVNVVAIDTLTGAQLQPKQLSIPAHTTEGRFDVGYIPNTAADPTRHEIDVIAYAGSGIETDDYIGRGVIFDDDREQSMTAAPVDRRVTEGDPARWTVFLGRPFGHVVDVVARPVADDGDRQLTVGDLPKKFREEHLSPVPPLDTPLSLSGLRIVTPIPTGQTSVTVQIPVRRTKSDDGRRTVRLSFRVKGINGVTGSPVTVVEPAN